MVVISLLNFILEYKRFMEKKKYFQRKGLKKKYSHEGGNQFMCGYPLTFLL